MRNFSKLAFFALFLLLIFVSVNLVSAQAVTPSPSPQTLPGVTAAPTTPTQAAAPSPITQAVTTAASVQAATTSPAGNAAFFDSQAIKLGYEPNQYLNPIVLRVPDTESTATFPLFLTNLSTQQFAGVLLFGVLKTEAGTAPLPTTLQFIDLEQNNAVLGRFDLKPGLKNRQVGLRISDLGAGTAFTGTISIDMGGEVQKLADLVVTRSSKPNLTFLEAGNGTDITLATTSPNLNETLILQETSGVALDTIFTATVTFGDFRPANGITATSSFSLTQDTVTHTVRVKQNLVERVNLRSQGQIPEVGDYRSVVILNYYSADQQVNIQKTYNLFLKRAVKNTQVSLEAISPFQQVRICPIFCSKSVTVQVNLTERGGQQVNYNMPFLLSLAQPVPGQTPGATANYNNEATAPDSGGFMLAPFQTITKTVKIVDVKSLGQHQGTIQLNSPDGVALKTDFFFNVKDDFYFPAALMIGCSFLSYFLRRWYQSGRAKLLNEITIKQTSTKIEEYIPDSQDPIRNAIIKRLSELVDQNKSAALTDTESKCQDLIARAQNYLNIQNIIAIKSKVDRYIVDVPTRLEILKDLNDVAYRLETDKLEVLGNTDADGKNPLLKQAEAAYTKLQEKAKSQVKTLLDKLSTNLEETAESIKNSSLDPASKANLGNEAEAIDELIQDAQREVATSQQNIAAAGLQFIPPAIDGYNVAQQRYTGLSARFVQKTIEQQALPTGIITEYWDRRKAQLLEELKDTPTQATIYKVRREYLQLLLTGMLNKLNEYLDKSIPPAIEAYKKMAKDDLKPKLEKALTQINDDLATAEKSFTDLQTPFKDWLKITTPTSAGVFMGGNPQATVVTNDRLGSVAGVNSNSPLDIPEKLVPTTINTPSLVDLQKSIKLNDRWTTLVLGAITIIIGLVTLWVPNPNFGSLVDYGAVLLWSFGLHALNFVALPTATNMTLPLFLPTGSAAPASGGNAPAVERSQGKKDTPAREPDKI